MGGKRIPANVSQEGYQIRIIVKDTEECDPIIRIIRTRNKYYPLPYYKYEYEVRIVGTGEGFRQKIGGTTIAPPQ